MAGEVLDIAELNLAVWSREETVAHFSRMAGFIDPGERMSLAAVAPRVRGAPVLDIGVGAGRTVSLLRLLTDEYVAVDYSPAMVSACRRLNPGVEVRAGDVRNLSDFQDGRFGLVFFSFSGIDAVSHTDRPRALREMFRLLRPGGWVVFSTHNRDGPSYGEVPWRGYQRGGSPLHRTVRWVLRLPFDLPRHARRWRNWWRNRRLNDAGDEWAIRAAAPHEFGIVIHYVSLRSLLAEVAAAGFTAVEVYDSERGLRIAPGHDVRQVHAFYVVAQRPENAP